MVDLATTPNETRHHCPSSKKMMCTWHGSAATVISSKGQTTEAGDLFKWLLSSQPVFMHYEYAQDRMAQQPPFLPVRVRNQGRKPRRVVAFITANSIDED